MNELKFDENLAIREVLDDIVGMVERREKLIRSASQQAEKSRDERMAQHVQKLEGLMSDFLALFDPILTKVKRYGEGLRESVSDSEKYLKSLVGIIEAGKAVEGTSATLQELEKDADGVQEELKLSSEALSKIEDLFKRTRQFGQNSQSPKLDDPLGPAMVAKPRRRQRREAKPRASGSYLLPGSRLLPDEPAKSQH
jgi:GTP1/Obg family GTP-binding protein